MVKIGIRGRSGEHPFWSLLLVLPFVCYFLFVYSSHRVGVSWSYRRIGPFSMRDGSKNVFSAKEVPFRDLETMVKSYV